MLRRPLLSALTKRQLSTSQMASNSATPMEDVMRTKLSSSLQPSYLEIFNDSHLHRHHAAMASSTSTETHFRVVITSEVFKGKMQPARHRMVYKCLEDEMKREGGIHALQLRTRTTEEWEREKAKEAEEGEKVIDSAQKNE